MSIVSRPLPCACVALALAAAAPATAQPAAPPVEPTAEVAVTPVPPSPRLAVGATRTLAGLAGPTATVRMTDTLALDLTLGIARLGGAMGADDRTAWGAAVGVRRAMVERERTALSVGGRLGLAHPAGADRATVVLEAPVRLELAAARWLTLFVEGGLAIAITPDGDAGVEGPGAPGETTWSLGAGGLAGGAGFMIAL